VSRWALRCNRWNYFLRRKVPPDTGVGLELYHCDPDVVCSNCHVVDESMHEGKKRFPILTRCHWLIVAYASRWVNDKRQVQLTGTFCRKNKIICILWEKSVRRKKKKRGIIGNSRTTDVGLTGRFGVFIRRVASSNPTLATIKGPWAINESINQSNKLLV